MISTSTTHTYAPGEYDAQVFVNAGPSDQPVTSDACKVHIKVNKPEAKLVCDKLTATPGAIDQTTGSQVYTLTAKATATNTTITSYRFDLGDNAADATGSSNTVSHTYAPGDYDAQVFVSSNELKDVTSDACKVHIQVKQKQQSSLVCTSLTGTPGEVAEDGSQAFSFTATASPNNATITNYVFTFGDGSADATVPTNAQTANADHTYAPGTYTASVKVNGTDADGKPISSAATESCKFKVTVPPPQVKNPNIKLTKTVDGVKAKQVAVGQQFVYQLVITNTGEKDLTNAKVTDTTPAGVTLLSADLGDIANNNWSYTIPSLAVGQSVTVNITAVVQTFVAGNLVNTACVNAPDVNPEHPDEMDSCDTATVTVPPVVTPPTPPQVLPATLVNTGAGSVIGLAAVVAIAGAIAHRLFLARKLSN
jgi:uncharacterized repeat protein (TIGR01451 family)